jgi:hypothetical protein
MTNTSRGSAPARQSTTRLKFKEAFNFEQNNAKLDLNQVAKEFEQERLKKALADEKNTQKVTRV